MARYAADIPKNEKCRSQIKWGDTHFKTRPAKKGYPRGIQYKVRLEWSSGEKKLWFSAQERAMKKK
jgi:hypothetical protein